ncbi:hypothetical protein CFP56_010946 [Quercus suber]|uniref:Uncharacterized protein n=1 Tax=Quercus suber TaxID=58331 RepID=A0AAW0L0M1_QUESU
MQSHSLLQLLFLFLFS